MSKILLVEDDKSLREIYGVRLLAEGYDIVSAGDGEEALAMAIKDRPDLIVSDVMMPKISGFDMLDILRSTTETKDIRVIMMTALSSEEQRQRGVSLGADRYLVKSQVGIEDVVRTVHEVLGDAPVTTASPASAFTTPTIAPTPQPAPTPVAVPVTPAPSAAPVAPQPVPITTPTPVAPVVSVAPIPSVTPTPVVAAAPVVAPSAPPASATAAMPAVASAATAPTVSEPVLPQPTAPFSTPRTSGNTLADRVIQPISTPSEAPDFGNLMNQELNQTPVAPAPAVAQPTVDYVETPLATQAPVAPTVAPSVPTPPQPPVTGV